MSDNPVVLEYGRTTARWYTRRRVWIALGSAIVLGLLYGVIFWIARPFFNQYRFLRLQDQVMSGFLAPGTVVYTDVDSTISALQGRPHYTHYTIHHFLGDPSIPKRVQRPLVHQRLVLLQARNGTLATSSAFRGLRHTPSGRPLIVSISLSVLPRFGGRVICLQPDFVTPASWKPGSRGKHHSIHPPAIQLDGEDSFTLYAGQPDSSDPTRLSFAYELNGERGVIDGQLTDLGLGELELTIRSGPARRAPDDWVSASY
jgi:hypothetical protein